MKVDIIRKYKWYILGLIVAWILMAVGLSFCSWDSNSIKNMSMNTGTADYDNKNIRYELVVDKNSNGIADVGDIVNYGKYYQRADAVAENPIKDPIRWIVVHKDNKELTLLSESVLAFGGFWNGRYINTSGDYLWNDSSFTQYYQNYMVSTLSMWLNSDYSPRHDRGTAFSPNASKLAMRGFMNEAFTSDEISYINNRTISGIQGMAQGNAKTELFNYGTKSYKVWVPSWSEMFDGTLSEDGTPNTQFEYFANRNYSAFGAKATPFALNPAESNYNTLEDTSHEDNVMGVALDGTTVWWLRSPMRFSYDSVYAIIGVVNNNVTTLGVTYPSGVRPAICINELA